MADFGDIKDKSLLSTKGDELLKNRQERMTNKSVPEVRTIEKIKQDQAEIAKLSENINKDFEGTLAEITRLSKRVEDAKNALAQLAQGRIHGAEKAFQQGVRTTTSPSQTLSDISSAARSSSVLGPSVDIAQRKSTSQIEENIAKNKAELSRQNDLVRETATNVSGNEPQIGAQMIQRQKLIQQIAIDQAALGSQKKMGIDTPSQYYRAAEITERVKKEQETSQIKQDVEAGKFGNKKQAEEQLDAITKRLISTFEQFDTAVKTGAKEAGELGKKFDETQKEYDKQKTAIKEMGGSSGGQSGIQVAGGIIGNLGTIAQGVGQAYRHIGVTSETTQAQNRIGFGQMANQRFTDAYGATQGDMSSLRRVMGDQYNDQVRRGLLMAGREDTAKLVETAGLGGKAVGTAVDTMTGPQGIWAGIKGFAAGGGAGAAAANVTSGLAQATPDAVQLANSVADYSKNNTQASTFLQSAQQMRQLQDTVSQISDFTSQGAADYNKNLTYATRGLGTGGVGRNYNKKKRYIGSGELGENAGEEYLPTDGSVDVMNQISEVREKIGGKSSDVFDKLSSVINKENRIQLESQAGVQTSQGRRGGGTRQTLQEQLTDPANVSMLADLGIGTKDLPGLVGAGKSALGKQFAKEGVGGIARAGQTAQVGYMDSPEQYFQARGMAAGAGGGAQDLEEIMKNAVANGMDSSKNIMEMVQATASLAQRSASMGISTFGGAAQGLGQGIDALRASGVSENMAVQAAQQSASFMENTTQSTDLTLDNVIETARLRRAFPDAKLWQMEAMQTASPAEVKELQGLYKSGDTKKAQALQNKMGIGNAITDAKGADQLGEVQAEQGTRSLTGFGIDRKLEESVQDARRSGRDLTEEEQAFVNSRGRGRGVSGEAAIAYIGNKGASKGGLQSATGGIVEGGEAQIAAGAQGDAKVFADGVENITKAVGGLEALGKTMEKVAMALKPEEFAKATQSATKDFQIPVNAFGKSVTQFDNAVAKLVDAVKDMMKDKPAGSGKTNLENNVNQGQRVR